MGEEEVIDAIVNFLRVDFPNKSNNELKDFATKAFRVVDGELKAERGDLTKVPIERIRRKLFEIGKESCKVIDQAEIHRKSKSYRVEERIEAAKQLGITFADLTEKHQAWIDLHRLIGDEDIDVRLSAANALGVAFPYISDKRQAWAVLHELSQDDSIVQDHWEVLSARRYPPPAYYRGMSDDSTVQDHREMWSWRHSSLEYYREIKGIKRLATEALGVAFPYVPEKEQVWDDLHRLSQDEDWGVRQRAAAALGVAFPYIPEKKKAWKDLHRLSQDLYSRVRRRVAESLGIAFSYLPDKEKAWADLVRLTKDEDSIVREHAIESLGIAFSYLPDKGEAWEYLIQLTQHSNHFVRKTAAYALGAAFPHTSDKGKAWNDLIYLTRDLDSFVRKTAAYALGAAFPHTSDKGKAWNDLIQLAHVEKRDVRGIVLEVAGVAFSHVLDKEKAWNDLIQLAYTEERDIRQGAAHVLGEVYPHTPDKGKAWDQLTPLTRDPDRDVRVLANHALGRASIFKATEAETEDEFRKEIENALAFFEASSRAAATYSDPATFCLPFYRVFYTVTFEKQEAETEVQKYLVEAKRATEGSEIREKLLEVIDNLASALSEAQKSRETSFDAIQSNFQVWKRHCDQATDLLRATEEKAPIATELIAKGLPIIDERIKELLGEIDNRTKILCDAARDTTAEKYVSPACKEVREIIKIRNIEELEKRVEGLIPNLRFLGDSLPEKGKIFVYNKFNKISSAIYLEDKLGFINEIIVHVTPYIEIEKKMDEIMRRIKKIESACDQIIWDIEERGVTIKEADKQELRTLADDLKGANKEQLTNFTNELLKLLEDPKIQQELEKQTPKQIARLKTPFSKIKDTLTELSIALSAAITAEGLLPYIEAIMSNVRLISVINPALASALLLTLIKFKGKALK